MESTDPRARPAGRVQRERGARRRVAASQGTGDRPHRACRGSTLRVAPADSRPHDDVRAEIRKALERSPRCDFRYTTNGKPVLAISLQSSGEALGGVVKLNGNLVKLAPPLNVRTSEGAESFVMLADPVRITVRPDQREQSLERRNIRRREANMIFEVGQSLKVGYRGYLDCSSDPAAPPRASGGQE